TDNFLSRADSCSINSARQPQPSPRSEKNARRLSIPPPIPSFSPITACRYHSAGTFLILALIPQMRRLQRRGENPPSSLEMPASARMQLHRSGSSARRLMGRALVAAKCGMSYSWSARRRSFWDSFVSVFPIYE
ncbi:hypothetical protein CP532_0083, partial [Ophiocordyceps camponoti-leonardi (nom. inval.)]